jgi:DNA processing protein
MSHRKYWICLSRVPGIGPARLQRLIEYFGDPRLAWEAKEADLAAAGLDQPVVENLLSTRRRLDPDAVMEQAWKAGAKVVTLADPEYPRLLKQIEGAPAVLYVRGELKQEDELAVAVVGTRSPTAYGRQAARLLATELAKYSVTVVSGLAMGIDTEAHRAALAAGGRTVAVLGSGIDRVYPPENRNLAERIAEQGAVVTDYPPGTRPDAFNFPSRNRIISGLSLGTVVVEAGARSGALITASFALEQGRDVFAVPGPITSPNSEGTNNLIRQGARITTGVADILEELNLHIVKGMEPEEPLPALDGDEGLVLSRLGYEPVHIDELCRSLGLPAGKVGSLLALMELKGLVSQVGPMTYVRTR